MSALCWELSPGSSVFLIVNSFRTGSELRCLRFGEFEADLAAWVLRRNQVPVRLQRKPFQILQLLLRNPGQLVTRATLAAELWPDLHVSFDHCLNTAVNSLRHALDDPPSRSHFIQTRPGLGYCFVASLIDAPGHGTEPSSGEAAGHDLALGSYFLHRASPESCARARAFFTAASQNPRHASQAHLALAVLQLLEAINGQAPTHWAAQQALLHVHAAGPGHPAAQAVLACATAFATGRYSSAIDACLSMERNSDIGLPTECLLSALLVLSGRPREALAPLHIASRSHPASLLIHSQLSFTAYLASDNCAALRHAWNALTIEPTYAPAQQALALAYLQGGNLEDALTEFQNAVTCSGGAPASLAGLSHALFRAGSLDQAAAIASRLHALSQHRYVSSCWQALAHLACQRPLSAADALTHAAESGDCLLLLISHDPRFLASTHPLVLQTLSRP